MVELILVRWACQKSTNTEADRSMVAQHVLKSMVAMIYKIQEGPEQHFGVLSTYALPQLAA
jgi:hypothetical protein